MRAGWPFLVAVLALTAPCSAADDVAAPTDVERLATSRATWEQARDAAGGNYSYEVPQVFMMSRQTTRFVVQQGKVVERSFEQFVGPPGPPPPGGGSPVPTTAWTETGADIGTHGDGAAPPRTVDELYDEAATLLARPAAEFKQRSLGINDRGFLDHCFDRDIRIADDGPLEGVKPFRITIASP